jgi:hypothetical protein
VEVEKEEEEITCMFWWEHEDFQSQFRKDFIAHIVTEG